MRANRRLTLDRHHVEVSLHTARHHWIRWFISWTGNCEPGHGLLYMGMVRRDAWRIGRVGFGRLKMRRTSKES